MFNEKDYEHSVKQGKKIPVWQSPKYKESRTKALEIIDEYDEITEGDFWILMNETKNGQMGYTGLIISHNGCLKLNDRQPLEKKFRPECVTHDKDGWGDSLVYSYCCPEQGLYEVGEVSKTNCKNSYPYAMAFKRMYDRVVLKLTKLAYAGIYSEVEADEFKRVDIETEQVKATKDTISKGHIKLLETVVRQKGSDMGAILSWCGVDSIEKMTEAQYGEVLNILNRRENVIGEE